MTYVPTWKKRGYPAGSAHTEELNICVQRIQIAEGISAVRFDDHGCGDGMEIPASLPMDVRKAAAIEIGYYKLIDRLKNYRESAAAMGIGLPAIVVDES